MNQLVLTSATALLLVIYIAAQDDNIEQEAATDLQYPTYDTVPTGLTFSCQERGAGYFADPETRCQVWHWCLPSGAKYSFLCPNGTLFNQRFRVCDWWFNVDCAAAVEHYKVNDDLYRNGAGDYI